ncbi:GGDEF domain-containing protein [Oceanispirochaeta sp.]|uniref:GGDEF domain-containing protein n=1 Tax=Oceanispirochaeta sp. TaxID=2035350 RepID=UPI002614FA09|nr:GGDEF domain-containing protein [Oceanispirochaeta sp.]MDA3958490.1 GGDEF domain-containing protein [Oceanispirochaeta sp.]
MTITLLIPHISYPLGKTLLDGVRTIAESNGDRVVSLLGSDVRGNIQYKLYNLASNKDVDGLIVYGGGLGQFISEEKVRSFLNQFSSKPLINIAYRVKGHHNLGIDNYQGMKEMVLHLIEEHGHSRIAYIHGPETHPEAVDRIRGYKDALLEHHILYDQDLIIKGDFTPESGYLAAGEIYKLLKDSRISAAAFSCDTMASAAVMELNRLGVSLPNDLALTGFDNSDDAISIQPGITTQDQQIHKLGQEAYTNLIRLIQGDVLPEDIVLPVKPVFRESCGCIPDMIVNVSLNTIDKTMKKEILPLHPFLLSKSSSEEKDFLIKQMFRDIKNDSDHCFIESMFKYKPLMDQFRDQQFQGFSTRKMQDFLSRQRQMILPDLKAEERDGFEKVWHQLRVMIHIQSEYSLTSRRVRGDYLMRKLNTMSNKMISVSNFDEIRELLDLELRQYNVDVCGISLLNPGAPVDEYSLEYFYSKTEGKINLPLKYKGSVLIPSELKYVWEKGTLLFRPLVTTDYYWGIIFFVFKKELSVHDGVFIDALSFQTASSLKQIRLIEERNYAEKQLKKAYQGLETANKTLEHLSYKDELTGLYNRRGFMDLAGQVLETVRQDKSDLILLFGDLDGLKTINDQFGHNQGDHAIISISKIIRTASRESDIIARLGGDEFVAVFAGIPENFMQVLHQRLHKAEEELNLNDPQQYKISCSFGMVLYSENKNSSISELMSLADQKLYQEKIRKTAQL